MKKVFHFAVLAATLLAFVACTKTETPTDPEEEKQEETGGDNNKQDDPTPKVLERTVDVQIACNTKSWREGFVSGVEADLTAAFGLTADELVAASASGAVDPKIALCDSSTEAYDVWDDSWATYLGLYHDCQEYLPGESISIAYGKDPSAGLTAGQVLNRDFAITCTSGDVTTTFTYHFNITIYEKPATERTVNIEIETASENWRAGFITGVEADLTKLFGLTADELVQASKDGKVSPQIALCDSDSESYDVWDDSWTNYLGLYYNCQDYCEGESIALAYGKYPGNLEAGQSFTRDFPVTYTSADGELTFTYHVNITTIGVAIVRRELELDVTKEAWLQGWITDYDDVLCEAFGLTKDEFNTYAKDASKITPNAVTPDTESNDSWYNAKGEFTGWSNDCAFYVGPYHSVSEVYGENYPEVAEKQISLAYGHRPGVLPAGVDFNIDYAVTYTPESGDPITYTFYFHVTSK